MDKQKRSRILARIRTRLYTCSSDTLVVLARSVNDEAPEDLSRGTALEGIEEKLETCGENDDGGEAFLDRLLSSLAEVKGEAKVDNAKVTPAGWRKEFKINGQIGDSVSSMGYMSFLRQVESGKERGYSEPEIVSAIIKAIQSHVRLRGYLESRDELTLAATQSLIRAFYKEKSSTELYQELCGLSQGAKETVQELLFRALELRQKIIFASKECGELSYDSQLVERQFCHSLSTGVRDEVIRSEFSVVLKSYQHDEELVEGLNKITRRFAERQSKFGTTNAASVLAVEESNIVKELRALRVEVGDLRKQVETRPNTIPAPRDVRQRRSGRKKKVPQLQRSQGGGTMYTLLYMRRCWTLFFSVYPGGGKLMTVNGSRGPLTSKPKPPCLVKCVMCSKPLRDIVKVCAGCHVTKYCSHSCQKVHRGQHKQIFNSIRALEHKIMVPSPQIDVNKLKGSVCEITPRNRNKIVKLVGDKCIVSVVMNGEERDVLWDTGAQVSLMGHTWFKDHFPEMRIQSVHELFNQGVMVKSVNGELLEFHGWVDIEIRTSCTGEPVHVPFLIAKIEIDHPILGYNVIMHLLEDTNMQSIFKHQSAKVVESVVSILRSDQTSDIGIVKLGRRHVVVPKGLTKSVKCTLHSGVAVGNQVVLFVPLDEKLSGEEGLVIHETVVNLRGGTTSSINISVTNQTCHAIILKRGTLLGHATAVKSIIALRPPDSQVGVSTEIDPDAGNISAAVGHASTNIDKDEQGCKSEQWDPDVKLDDDDFTSEQVTAIRKMLREECNAFSKR